jgi:hypothetical protein
LEKNGAHSNYYKSETRISGEASSRINSKQFQNSNDQNSRTLP